MKKIFSKINPRILIVHLIITLGYPAARAFSAEKNRLMLFTDSVTIIALVLLIGGIIYALLLRGDFDISGFLMHRGMHVNTEETYKMFKESQKQKREDAFNYPLFLGILYLIVSAVIAWFFL